MTLAESIQGILGEGTGRIARILAGFALLFLIGWFVHYLKHAGGKYAEYRKAKKLAYLEKRGLKKEQRKELELERTEKHFRQEENFQEKIISGKKFLFFGKQGERIHSSKAVISAKQMAEIADDLAHLWNVMKKTGVSKERTRFNTQLKEFKRAESFLRLNLLSLLEQIKQEVFMEREELREEERAESIISEEEQEENRMMVLEKKIEREGQIMNATSKQELLNLKDEYLSDEKLSKLVKTLEKANYKLLDFNKAIYRKAQFVIERYLPQLDVDREKASFDLVSQIAHNSESVCYNIDRDVLFKLSILKIKQNIDKQMRKLLRRKKKGMTKIKKTEKMRKEEVKELGLTAET